MNHTQKDFLNKVVTPYFMGNIQKDVISVIYNLDGKIHLCTNQFAKMLGYNCWKDLQGKAIADFSLQMPQCEPEFYHKLEMIRQKVVTESVSVQYINFLYNSLGIISQIVYHFPIFTPDGSVVGSRVIANNFNMVNDGISKFMLYLRENKEKLLNKPNQIEETHPKINLTDKEYAIVFLIAAELNMEEISLFLDIPIDKVLHSLEEISSHKLGLPNLEVGLLKKTIINTSLIDKLPRKFMKPRSIIIHSKNDYAKDIIIKS